MYWIPLAMMAAGAAKGRQDQVNANRQRGMEAEIARWSPWTGMQPQRVQEGSGVLGGALQGAVGGLGMQQAWDVAHPQSVDTSSVTPPASTGGQTAVAVQPGTAFYPQQNPAAYGQYDAFGNTTWSRMNQPQPMYMASNR